MPVADAELGQVETFRTGFQGQMILLRDIRKTACQLIYLRRVQGLKLFAQMPVQVNKADDALLGVPGQPLGQFLKIIHMVISGVPRRQEDGIIPPDDPLRANSSGQLLKSRNDSVIFAGDARLQILSVGRQGELKIEGVVFQKGKAVQHGNGILCPEHDTVHHLRGQGDAADLVKIHRIADADEPRFQAAKEPRGIVSRYVRPPAGADNHGATPLCGYYSKSHKRKQKESRGIFLDYNPIIAEK